MCVLSCLALPVCTRIDSCDVVVEGSVYIERLRITSKPESHGAWCQCQLSVGTGKNSQQNHFGARVVVQCGIPSITYIIINKNRFSHTCNKSCLRMSTSVTSRSCGL